MAGKSSAAGTGENFSLQIVRKALLREADKGFKQNFIGSPLSISFFLNLFAAGTKGPILDGFLETLDAKSLDELHDRTRKFRDLATANGGDRGPVISTANGVWINQICSVKDSFREILESVYEIDAKPLDFGNKSVESANEINSWVSEKTRGLIREITNSNSIKETLILIANTLYFKADWVKQFSPRRTKNNFFHLLNGEKINVKFMTESGSYCSYCSSFDGFKILKLPYRSKNAASFQDKRQFSMYFFLPDETNGLRKLIDGSEFLNQDFECEYARIRMLMIPKFKFENDFIVSDMMKELGFPIPDLAETEMIDNSRPDYSNPVRVVQKAFIAVDEKGTEAAAVTYMEAMGCSRMSMGAEIDFIADHPFLFMIREDDSKVPFFIGAVVNPGGREVEGNYARDFLTPHAHFDPYYYTQMIRPRPPTPHAHFDPYYYTQMIRPRPPTPIILPTVNSYPLPLSYELNEQPRGVRELPEHFPEEEKPKKKKRMEENYREY